MKDFKQCLGDQYEGPLLDGPLKCEFLFFMPIPKATSIKKRDQMYLGELRPVCKPDMTNLIKLYEDCLQGVVIKNDSTIVEYRAEKRYSEYPLTQIRIQRPW